MGMVLPNARQAITGRNGYFDIFGNGMLYR
jgi:hypothetical protein